MCKLLFLFSFLISSIFSLSAFADDHKHYAMLEKLTKIRPGLVVKSVNETAAKGIFRIDINNGQAIYLTENGQHFFMGDFFAISDSGLVNLGEQAKEKDRVVALSALSLSDMIVFAPEQSKAHVYVFTDVECYYCQKLHQEVPALEALGIEVRYLAYPRAGIGSDSYKKIASAWCADDPQDSLTTLKAGGDIPSNVCEDNPIAQQFALGSDLGVKGTPALITEAGVLLPGYMPADKLARALGL
ncbi:MAG: protein-disulfide isomerase [Cellvibrionales bacterium]|nr:protein-disulfide isomerase [Cellvibrionales bacterium]|tara:strand:- start:458 stop:1186 length:729 start_codon:yes stop_codon:yes gene_type:complete